MKYLYCNNNQLTALDVSQNTALKELSCGSNQLTALDVSNNTALKELYCGNNQLTALDVSHNTALTELYCFNNRLTALDVSHNTALTALQCNNNQLTSLNVLNNTHLTEIYCYKNRINAVNMAALVASLPTVEGGNGAFRVIDLDSDTEHNVITPSQVATARGKGWRVLGWTNHNWEDYDGVLGIDEINFPDENFRNWLLSQPSGSDRVLTNEEIAYFTLIDVSNKSIADLTGIEHFTALTSLSCNDNQLSALDVSNNTALTQLICYNNQLTALDVSDCTALATLYCDGNQLTALDVSHNTALRGLSCSYNELTVLDVSHNTALTDLNCSSNQLTALDVSHNTALIWLQCYNNQIYGENMAALVASLPIVDVSNNYGQNGQFNAINLDSETEQNVITITQVATARGKNWRVWSLIDEMWHVYDGSEPTTVPGDLNGDSAVDVSDVNILINLVLENITPAEVTGNPDLDGNGTIDIGDVNALINRVLN